MKSYIKNLALLFIVVVTAILVFIYSGWYQIGADTRHNKLTYWALETLRDHSVARAASEIQRPADLESSARLLRGGPDYNEMCVSCHLAPGKSSTDFTKGLYPKPPDLTRKPLKTLNAKQLAQRRFWIIKHGIKASAMPSWAPNHDDERIWDMVAFIDRLPELTIEQYQVLTERGPGSSNHHH